MPYTPDDRGRLVPPEGAEGAIQQPQSGSSIANGDAFEGVGEPVRGRVKPAPAKPLGD